MGSVADLVRASALEPSRKRELDLAVERVADERGRRLARAADDEATPRHQPTPLVVRQHDGRSRMRDRELLGGDLVARVAEDVGVLEADVRQQDDGRVEDVRRVEAAAEPGLDDGGVDFALGEVCERGGRERLELRRGDGLRGGAHARDRSLERVRVGVEALVPAAHVRRRVRADGQAVHAEQLGDRARRRRLAVRADDVHRPERTLRVSERVEECVHPAEAELLRPRREQTYPLGRRHQRMR